MSVTRGQCDAGPTVTFPAATSISWYQIIVLGVRGTCVLTTCPGLHSTAETGEVGIRTRDLLIASPAFQPLGHRATQLH